MNLSLLFKPFGCVSREVFSCAEEGYHWLSGYLHHCVMISSHHRIRVFLCVFFFDTPLLSFCVFWRPNNRFVAPRGDWFTQWLDVSKGQIERQGSCLNLYPWALKVSQSLSLSLLKSTCWCLRGKMVSPSSASQRHDDVISAKLSACRRLIVILSRQLLLARRWPDRQINSIRPVTITERGPTRTVISIRGRSDLWTSLFSFLGLTSLCWLGR